MNAKFNAIVPRMSPLQSLVCLTGGLVAFHVAYFWEPAGIVIFFYLMAMFYLPRLPSRRWAFYVGFLLGYAIGVPHLFFLFGIFGWGAIGLWGVFALWFAFYVLLGRLVLDRWPYAARWLLPCLWFGLEFFRSELYPLRFSWLIPGFALSHPLWSQLTLFGVYGFSFLVLMAVAIFNRLPWRLGVPWLIVCVLLVAAQTQPRADCAVRMNDVQVAGMQMESPTEMQVLDGLNKLYREVPQAELLLLSEYTFEGPVPESVRVWCKEHHKYLVVGGQDRVESSEDSYNTIFVISPEGEVVFKQAKAQPIPFFDDGLPAPSQEVWESPWGRIGIAICYDMSYTRVLDPLIRQDVQSLIIPAVDVITWGQWEHELHAKIAVIRAKEYGLPVFRLASSGISTFVDPRGGLLAEGHYPGHGEILVGVMEFDSPGVRPLDRFVAMPMVVGVGVIILLLMMPVKKHE